MLLLLTFTATPFRTFPTNSMLWTKRWQSILVNPLANVPLSHILCVHLQFLCSFAHVELPHFTAGID